VLNAANKGYAAACNQGFKKGSAPSVLFLNPDVRVRHNTLEGASSYLADLTNSAVGVVGVQLLDAHGHVQRSCARAPTLARLLVHTVFLDRVCPALVPTHFLTDWNHADTRPVDQVIGAFLMIRRRLFEQLGGFDERFFLYYEDADLCLRVRQAHWSVVHLACAQAEHDGGGTTEAVKDRRLFYRARSQVEFVNKHNGLLAAIVLTALIASFEMPIRLIHATVARSRREGWLVIVGLALFWRSLPGLFRSIVARM
jgi:N-acetylglucosaminyl-diphospho-decaprenol L-rhamnosyltransferase